MNLFRSEEHITRWLGARTPGATIPVVTLSALAHAWWGDRLSPDWAPRCELRSNRTGSTRIRRATNAERSLIR